MRQTGAPQKPRNTDRIGDRETVSHNGDAPHTWSREQLVAALKAHGIEPGKENPWLEYERATRFIRSFYPGRWVPDYDRLIGYITDYPGV